MPDDLDAYLDPAPRPKKPDTQSALNLISKYESGDRNIPNYRFDPGHTAQGYHQITNTNWRSFGPRAGVDVKQYPSAMAAPRDVQEKVAGLMYKERGFADWAPFNPRLKAAIARGEAGRQPQPQGELDSYLDPTPTTQPARPPRIKPPASPWGTGTIGQGVKPTRVGPRGIAAASVQGEAQPSPATAGRKLIRQVGGPLATVLSAGVVNPDALPTDLGDYVSQGAADAGAGLMERGAGLALQAPGLPMGAGAPVAEKIRAGSSAIRQASAAMDADTQRAGVNVPGLGRVSTKDVQQLGSSTVASAPALILQRMGVPGPLAFGLDAYLASTGRGEDFTQVMKDTGLAGLTGALYDIPLTRRIGLVGQIAAKLGIGGAGGYGLAKAFGLPEPEARKFGAQTGVMMATGAEGREPSALSRGLDREIANERTATPRPEVPKVPEAVPEAPAAEATQPAVDTVTPRHVDLQRRLDDGTFGRETAAEAEARRAQVTVPQQPAEPSAVPPAEQPPEAAATPVASTAPAAVKTPKLALGVEAKAVAAKLTKGFEDLPEYQTVNVADQAARATDLLKSDPARARRIAMGSEMPDSDLLPESVFTAVENHALRTGDIQTIQDLASSSTRPGEASVMGQRIRMLGERNPASPVKVIADIQAAREARAQRVYGKNGANKIKSEIQVEVRRAAPKARDWASFLEEIRCK